MLQPNEIQTLYAESRQEWRSWLAEHHDKKQSIWLIQNKKGFDLPIVTWSEAVDEALCFGWIDSTRRSVDDGRYMQLFSRRKASSVWSKINKDKVVRLTEQGLMSPAGLAVVEVAKRNGSWAILDDVEELTIPKDLTAAFKRHRGSRAFFLGLSRSVRKRILQWVVVAKRPETRQKRIDEIAELAGQGLRAEQFR